LYLDPTQRFRCAADRDVLVGLEREQIGIAGDDEIGFGFERTGEHVIVIRIRVRAAARRNSQYDMLDFDRRNVIRQITDSMPCDRLRL
jgi:hypothetical protein